VDAELPQLPAAGVRQLPGDRIVGNLGQQFVVGQLRHHGDNRRLTDVPYRRIHVPVPLANRQDDLADRVDDHGSQDDPLHVEGRQRLGGQVKRRTGVLSWTHEAGFVERLDGRPILGV